MTFIAPLRPSAGKDKERRQLDKQASRLAPGVVTLEKCLGLSIEGMGSAYISSRPVTLATLLRTFPEMGRVAKNYDRKVRTDAFTGVP